MSLLSKNFLRYNTKIKCSLFFLVILLGSSCSLFTGTKKIHAGVQRETLKDGSIHLVITGRASANARKRNSFAMMKTTSCQAAKAIVMHELANGFYENSNKNYIIQNVEIIKRGEYCRINGLFNPSGHSKEVKKESIPLRSLR